MRDDTDWPLLAVLAANNLMMFALGFWACSAAR